MFGCNIAVPETSCSGIHRYRMKGMILAWLLLASWCAPARGDGGTVFLLKQKGGYRITVFTAPTPFRAGPVDISVLIQDAATGEPLPQTQVTLRLSQTGQPALEHPATQEAATNKLLRAAQFELPAPGRWQLEVHVEANNEPVVVDGELDAAEPVPRWLQMWPWYCWPALVIALFGVHQVLSRRRAAGGAL